MVALVKAGTRILSAKRKEIPIRLAKDFMPLAGTTRTKLLS